MAIPKLALIPSGVKAGKLYSVLPTNGDGDFTTTRASVATRVNENGLIEEVASNVPRLDYSDGGCPSLLLEPERLQLIQYSEDFSQSSWVKASLTITSDTLISPSGILNGSTLTDNTANTIHRLRDSISLSASTDYGLSIFAKKGTLSNIQLALINTANSNTASRVFDLENGVLGESINANGTVSDSKITDYGNGWYRCEITAQLDSTPNTYQITLAPQSSGNSTTGEQVTYDGDGNGNVHLWGAMLEQGSYATSYIPNYGTSAGITRVADTANGAGDASTFNDSEGVLMAEISALANDGTIRTFSLSSGSSANSVRFYFGANNTINYNIKVGGANQFTETYTLNNQQDFNKFVFKYKSNDFALWVNGFEVGIISSGNTPIGLSEIAFDSGDGSSDIYSSTKQIQYYDSALNDSDLETLTSWTSFTAMANAQSYTII